MMQWPPSCKAAKASTRTSKGSQIDHNRAEHPNIDVIIDVVFRVVLCCQSVKHEAFVTLTSPRIPPPSLLEMTGFRREWVPISQRFDIVISRNAWPTLASHLRFDLFLATTSTSLTHLPRGPHRIKRFRPGVSCRDLRLSCHPRDPEIRVLPSPPSRDNSFTKETI